MKIKQLSVFLENKPGRLSIPCKALAKANINILTLSLADTRQFGILRLVVRDWEKARQILEKADCVVKVTDVIAIEVANRPGGLAEVLEIIEQVGMNLEYMYAYTSQSDGRAILIFSFEDVDVAVKTLQSRGVNVIDSVELYRRSSQ